MPLAPEPAPRTVVLYDGVCDLCDTGMNWLRARDTRGRLEFLTIDDPDVERRWPRLDPAELARALHVVTPEGRVYVGVDAAPVIFGALPGYEVLGRIANNHALRALLRPLYAWLAARRHIFLTGHRRGV